MSDSPQGHAQSTSEAGVCGSMQLLHTCVTLQDLQAKQGLEGSEPLKQPEQTCCLFVVSVNYAHPASLKHFRQGTVNKHTLNNLSCKGRNHNPGYLAQPKLQGQKNMNKYSLPNHSCKGRRS